MSDLESKRDATPPDDRGDPIEALLRLTGPRPRVPAERAERVKDAVRAHWRSGIEGSRKRNRRRVAAALAVAATIVVAIGVGVLRRGDVALPVQSAGHVERVAGAALLLPSATLAAGDEIAEGSELSTDAGGLVAMRLASGHSVRLDAGTRLRVLPGGALALDRGAVYVDSRGPDGAAAGALEIRTPLGSVSNVGTQYEVRLGEASVRIRVREGAVSLAGAGATHRVDAGEELELDDAGRTVRRELTGYGEGWSWVDGITPMLDLEGRSLREFLDWVVRERGQRLRFAVGELEDAASTTTLSGSIQGMTLDQALESVLPTCGMRHRTDGDVLRIESLRGDPETSS